MSYREYKCQKCGWVHAAISTLCIEAIRSADGNGTPQMQPTITNTTVDPRFPPLDSVTRPTITTEEASFYLNRRPQTLRGWACHEDGPIRPQRVYGRLSWPVAEIKQLLNSASRYEPGKTRKK